MADIQEKDSGKKKGKQKKINTRLDFTPMVDMNMLLITSSCSALRSASLRLWK